MATTINKQRLLTQIFTLLKKRYGPGEPETRPVLEQFIYAVCREGAGGEAAARAYRGLQERFFDWNEIRVSSIREVEEALGDLQDAEIKAQRLIAFLQEVFETTYSFELESLHKKGVKQAAKHISRYQASTPFAIAWVTQHSLDGHAIPADAPVIRALQRMGILDESRDDPEAASATLEHLIPKIKGPLFYELISSLADELCCEEEPSCGSCPLSSDCPTGQEVLSATVSAGRGRPKPR